MQQSPATGYCARQESLCFVPVAPGKALLLVSLSAYFLVSMFNPNLQQPLLSNKDEMSCEFLSEGNFELSSQYR